MKKRRKFILSESHVKNNKCIFIHHVRNGPKGKQKIDFYRVDVSARNEDVEDDYYYLYGHIKACLSFFFISSS